MMLNDLKLLAPEMGVVASLVVMFLVDAFGNKRFKGNLQLGVSILALLGIAVLTCKSFHSGVGLAFSGLMGSDRFSLFFRLLFLLASGLAIFLGMKTKELDADDQSEFVILIFALLFGVMTMVGANHLLSLYLAIETVSIISFVLAGFHRTSIRANEAAIKYLIYGGVSSAVMLFGMSLIYGLTGSLSYPGIAKFFVESLTTAPPVINLALLFVFAGFAYKISAFPMQLWTPDVYEGAPIPVVAFFSIAPKAAGIAALIRFLLGTLALPSTDGSWTMLAGVPVIPFLAIVSAITMMVGNFSAVGQRNVKRILAYSSIAHVGYLLMGLCVMTQDSLSAILFYLLVYCFMNVGAFWVVSMVKDATGSDDLDGYCGLGWRNPFLGIVLAIFLFSLTGIPLFSGFIGKFLLFSSLIKAGHGYLWLAVFGVLNSVVSLFYYANILRAVWLEKPNKLTENVSDSIDFSHRIVLSLLAVPTIALGLYWGPVFECVQKSVLGLLH